MKNDVFKNFVQYFHSHYPEGSFLAEFKKFYPHWKKWSDVHQAFKSAVFEDLLSEWSAQQSVQRTGGTRRKNRYSSSNVGGKHTRRWLRKPLGG